ncbi:MAG: exodeoxyribonuclease VII large subunit [Zoogloeaceae bacterium]|jgi:exodeoxyribonuclease VII large subunit|nr:exodeoxyribonuclease VII large subunit [Zoogloeaceae bacterium]
MLDKPLISPLFGAAAMEGAALSVGELNRAVRGVLEGRFPLLWVMGEVSSLTRATSGHVYFTLKDAEAQARCVLWRNKAQLVGFRLENGQKVRARVGVTLYEARGDYQLAVENLRLAGQGALFERFLALKTRLEAEGLFAAGQKRPLPTFVRRVAIVSSPQAAALQDVLATFARRAPHVRLALFPTPVQGEGAGQEIARALLAAATTDHDAILLCRGGGGMEDLWAFNDEGLARAIRASRLPVVCGVGHETDFCIADFAADLRAPTPTAAAELICPAREELLERLAALRHRLAQGGENRLRGWAQRLDYLDARLPSPAQQILLRRESLCVLAVRLQRAARQGVAQRQDMARLLAPPLARHRPRLEAKAGALSHLHRRLRQAAAQLLRRPDERLTRLGQGLRQLDPEAVLSRGYAIAARADGSLLRDAATAFPGETLSLTLARGKITARVVEKSIVEKSCKVPLNR